MFQGAILEPALRNYENRGKLHSAIGMLVKNCSSVLPEYNYEERQVYRH